MTQFLNYFTSTDEVSKQKIPIFVSSEIYEMTCIRAITKPLARDSELRPLYLTMDHVQDWEKYFDPLNARTLQSLARSEFAKEADPADICSVLKYGMEICGFHLEEIKATAWFDPSNTTVLFELCVPSHRITKQKQLEEIVKMMQDSLGWSAADTWQEGDITLFEYTDIEDKLLHPHDETSCLFEIDYELIEFEVKIGEPLKSKLKLKSTR